jgi:hypothetical protein
LSVDAGRAQPLTAAEGVVAAAVSARRFGPPDRDFERYADDPSGPIVAGWIVSDGLLGRLEISTEGCFRCTTLVSRDSDCFTLA